MGRDEFVRAMRHVASSVGIVTTNGPSGLRGATVSAFCSVSADPPTILVCLHQESGIARCVAGNGVFNLNVLSQDCEALSEKFAGRRDCAAEDRFCDIEVVENSVPTIPGALVFECELSQHFIAGSHKIMMGRVNAISGNEINPLVYLDGAYRQISLAAN